MTEGRRPGGHPGDVGFGLWLGALALAPRLYAARVWAGEPVWDGHYYDFGARRIAAGFGYSDEISIAGHVLWHPWCHYPVGYSAVLGAAYKMFGASTATAAWTNAVIGACLAVMTWLLAREGFSPWRARVAGLIVALHPGLIMYAALVMTEPLATLATLLAFWLTARARRPWWGVVFGGLALGLATLVRPQAILCAPFLALPVWSRGAGLRATLGASALACVATLLPVLPWTARNCRVMDGCALVSTNAGWNLAIGSFPRATGRFEPLHASDGCSDVTGQVQQDRCWMGAGLAQIRAAPARWLRLVPAKLAFTFDHESFAVEYLHEARPSLWPEDRRRAARGILTFAHRGLLLAAALGATFGRGRSRRAWRLEGALLVLGFGTAAALGAFWPLAVLVAFAPLTQLHRRFSGVPVLSFAAVLVATSIVTHAVFFGEDRYHVVVVPALALAAVAWSRSRGLELSARVALAG